MGWRFLRKWPSIARPLALLLPTGFRGLSSDFGALFLSLEASFPGDLAALVFDLAHV